MGIIILENFFNKKNYDYIQKKIKIIKSKKFKKDVKYIFCRLNKKLTSNYLNQFSNLKYIITPTTGTTHIYSGFPQKKIIKLNPKEIQNIKSASELNLILILSASRKLFDYIYNSRQKLISRYTYKTLSFRKLTVGIIGCGRIGSYLVKKLKFLGFKTLYYDNKKKAGSVKLKKLMQISDIISLNISSEKKNYNFLNYKLMSTCKKKPILINISRGELINENDLYKSLDKGYLSEAYLDVLSNEQRIIANKKYSKKLQNLISLNKIKITPHIGGSNLDSMITTENLVLKKFLNKVKK